MLQTLKSRRNRKGFTLAELLIVVAIIAVLVAIAVPLFVGALNGAEDRVKEANIRAVRAAAVEKILMNDDAGIDYQHVVTTTGSGGDTTTTTAKAVAWTVTAYVSAGGDLHNMTIKPLTAKAGTAASCEKLKEAKAGTGEGAANIAEAGEYEVILEVTELTATKG